LVASSTRKKNGSIAAEKVVSASKEQKLKGYLARTAVNLNEY
jgi:hypothetical protein